MQDIDAAIRERAQDGVHLLIDLVRSPSTIGREAGAQEVLALALGEAGFAVERLELPLDIADDPLAGVQQMPYEGRYDLVARRRGTPAAGGRRSLLLNGYIDVVPVEDAGRWSVPPFAGVVKDGWMIGRGAGDMKCGFVAGLLAIEALDAVRPGWLTGDLTLVSVIEAEATGNGTLAASRAGVLADAALLLVPTDLEVVLGGIGMVWVDVVVHGLAGRAGAADPATNPILLAPLVIDALADLEDAMNAMHAADPDPAFAAIDRPYTVNVGRFESGLWPSSAPEAGRLCVRVGHPGQWSSDEAVERIGAAVRTATSGHPWLGDNPPEVKAAGFRAERYAQDPAAPIVAALAAAHRDAHGEPAALTTIASTTDARYYVNRFGVPAAAYGPRVRNIHGVDEAVELESVLASASTIARLLLTWFDAT
ncbi:MAG TPA: M20/M25/M40 family metallo-hydrolase [Amnibacterium sp.]|uniref:M20/M25/M40 family metallo-hydrolase n=1 Tax=Amnibacterium sp. TaxID=1872496 RepID=UPI002F94EFE0